MARSRNIKPAFFFNEQLAEVDPLGRILFIGLWSIADREGRLEDRPKKIKAEVLAYDDCEIELLLTQLYQKDFIIRYEVEGKKYIWIKKFTAHQNPHYKEKPSTIPPYCPPTDSSLNSPPRPLDTVTPLLNALPPVPLTPRPLDTVTPLLNALPPVPPLPPVLPQTSPADSLELIPDSPSLMPDSFDPEPGAGEKTAAAAVEREFGRPLSPLEWEQVTRWEEKFSPLLVQEALKIAVLKGVCRLKFIDAILLEWEKGNVRTYHEVMNYELRRKGKGRVGPISQFSSVKNLDDLYEL